MLGRRVEVLGDLQAGPIPGASWDDMGSDWFKGTSERCLSPNLGEFCRFSHPTLGLKENEVGTPQFFLCGNVLSLQIGQCWVGGTASFRVC